MPCTKPPSANRLPWAMLAAATSLPNEASCNAGSPPPPVLSHIDNSFVRWQYHSSPRRNHCSNSRRFRRLRHDKGSDRTGRRRNSVREQHARDSKRYRSHISTFAAIDGLINQCFRTGFRTELSIAPSPWVFHFLVAQNVSAAPPPGTRASGTFAAGFSRVQCAAR